MNPYKSPASPPEVTLQSLRRARVWRFCIGIALMLAYTLLTPSLLREAGMNRHYALIVTLVIAVFVIRVFGHRWAKMEQRYAARSSSDS